MNAISHFMRIQKLHDAQDCNKSRFIYALSAFFHMTSHRVCAKVIQIKQSNIMSAKNSQVICVNRRARHEYEIIETYEAGLVLLGWEVKAIRQNKVSLASSYALMKDGECWVIGAHIAPGIHVPAYLSPDPERRRKCLLQRKCLDKLIGAVETKGLTLVPLRLYWRGPYIKLELGLVRGRKKHDKRQHEKAQDWQRQAARINKTIQ